MLSEVAMLGAVILFSLLVIISHTFVVRDDRLEEIDEMDYLTDTRDIPTGISHRTQGLRGWQVNVEDKPRGKGKAAGNLRGNSRRSQDSSDDMDYSVLYNATEALGRLLDYYEANLDRVTVECLFGFRIAEFSLYEAQRRGYVDNMAVTSRIITLSNQLREINNYAYPMLSVSDPVNASHFRPLISEEFNLQMITDIIHMRYLPQLYHYPFYTREEGEQDGDDVIEGGDDDNGYAYQRADDNVELDGREEPGDDSEASEDHRSVNHGDDNDEILGSYDEIDGDECFIQIMGTDMTSLRCTMSDVCIQNMMTSLGTGYYLTHQVLYVMVALYVGCVQPIRDVLYPITVEERLDRACAKIYNETVDQSESWNNHTSFTQPGFLERDLFTERLVLCGSLGYSQFINHSAWLTTLHSWQHPEHGCYGSTLYETDNHVEPAPNIVDGCSPHMSGLAAAYMAQVIQQQAAILTDTADFYP